MARLPNSTHCSLCSEDLRNVRADMSKLWSLGHMWLRKAMNSAQHKSINWLKILWDSLLQGFFSPRDYVVLKCEHEYQMLDTSAGMELGFIRFVCVWCEVCVVQAHTCMWLCMPMHAHRGRGVGVLLCHDPPYSPKAGSLTGARLVTSKRWVPDARVWSCLLMFPVPRIHVLMLVQQVLLPSEPSLQHQE